MALIGADSEIGGNTLQMFSVDEQEWNDYQTMQTLVSAVVAKADYQCPIPPSAFSDLGPNIVAEVTQEQARVPAGLIYQTANLQQIVDTTATEGAQISNVDIASAPVSTPIGSAADAGSTAYTDTQIAAANYQPINWAKQMTVQRSRRKYTAQFAPAGGGSDQGHAGQMPGTPWSVPSASTPGHCDGIQGFPWGKLLLFAGLGVITLAVLNDQ